jgi:ABC-2 type transport system permease protein
MWPIVRYELVRLRWQIIGWGSLLLLVGALVMPMYEIALRQREQIEQLIQGLPPGFAAFFGNVDAIFQPEGFLSVRYFTLMPLLLGVFAVLVGSGLLASDEEKGILDLVVAHPVSRSELYLGRLTAFASATLAILAIGWLGLIVPMHWSSLHVGAGAMTLPFLSLLAVLLAFGTLALLLSMVLPSRRSAAMAAGLALVASYFITSFARINKDLEPMAKLSPLSYYQSGEAILGLNGSWFGGLLAVACVFGALAWWLFERRDIRVSGEGVWALPRHR